MQLREIQNLEGHDDRVWYVAWSPSGTSFASCSGDKTVRIWSKDNKGLWKCTSVLEGAHTRTVRSCSWSPNGRFLATASFDRTIAIWEHVNDNWEQAAVLEGHESEVKHVAWNPNGSLLATCGRDRTVWVWEAQPGHEYEVIDVKHGHSQDVKTVVWHPHGELLVSASYDDSIKLWKESDDEWICCQTIGSVPVGHTSTVWDVAFSPQGDYLASCSDDTSIKIWKVDNRNGDSCSCSMISTLAGYHARTIFSIHWSANEYIATGSADNSIHVFKATLPGNASEIDSSTQGVSMECRVELDGDVNCVRWNPMQPTILASAGDDGSIKIWELCAV